VSLLKGTHFVPAAEVKLPTRVTSGRAVNAKRLKIRSWVFIAAYI
jgi:hypothetical protein